MRRAYLGCTLALFMASGSAGAQTISQNAQGAILFTAPVPSSDAIETYRSNYIVPIPVTVRRDMPVLRGTYLTNSSSRATWVYLYRPLGVSSIPTGLTLSRSWEPRHRRRF